MGLELMAGSPRSPTTLRGGTMGLTKLEPPIEILKRGRKPFEAADHPADPSVPHARQVHGGRRGWRAADTGTAAPGRPAPRQHQGQARRADRLPRGVGRRGVAAGARVGTPGGRAALGLRPRYCPGCCRGGAEEGRGVSEERLGLELWRIREERGLTVEELADKSGVSATTIRDVERGAREARGDTVAKLAKPLGLTFDEVWELQRRRT